MNCTRIKVKLYPVNAFFTPLEVVVHAGSLSDARTEVKLASVHLAQIVPLTTILADPKGLMVVQVVQVVAVV